MSGTAATVRGDAATTVLPPSGEPRPSPEQEGSNQVALYLWVSTGHPACERLGKRATSGPPGRGLFVNWLEQTVEEHHEERDVYDERDAPGDNQVDADADRRCQRVGVMVAGIGTGGRSAGAEIPEVEHPSEEEAGPDREQPHEGNLLISAEGALGSIGADLQPTLTQPSLTPLQLSGWEPLNAQGVALYMRVSTEDQDLAGQERELRTEAARRGWIATAAYAEKVSGTGKVERTEYARLLFDARKPGRPWTQLLVWSLDRFSREATFTKATQAVLDLERAGVRFHSLKEPTLDTPDDGRPNLGRDVLLALLPVIAAFESKRRSERVRLAMAELKAGRRQTRSGRPPGRPVRVTPEKRAAILRWKAEGLTWRAVAQEVGIPRGTCANVASKARRVALPNSAVPKGSPGPPEGAPIP